jgi:hypothetical protein
MALTVKRVAQPSLSDGYVPVQCREIPMPLRQTRFAREESNRRASVCAQKRGIAYATRCVLIEILRRSSVYDSDDPQIIEWACDEQNRIAKMIERMNERHDRAG